MTSVETKCFQSSATQSKQAVAWNHLGLIVIGCLLIVTVTSPVWANDWTNGSGGSFQTPGNWSGGVPGAGDNARFVVVGGDYTVTFSANAASNVFSMTQSTVTLDLNGHHYDVNQLLPQTSSPLFNKLRIKDGRVNVANGIGLQWNRVVEVISGGHLDVNGMFGMGPGTNNSSRSTVLISGTNSQISADSLAIDGAWGGTVTIESNGTLATTGASTLRTTSTSGWPATVRGGPLAELIIRSGGTWDSNGQITLGGTSGEGAIYVDSGGLLNTASIVLNDVDSILEVDGGTVTAGSLQVTSGSFNHRDGSVTIDGGTFDPGASMTGSAIDFHIVGASAGDHAIVTLKNGATWNAPLTRIARGENGTLNIRSGANVNVAGSLILGMGTENATGTINVTGTGSALTAPNLFVGSNEKGILNVSNGGQVTANNSLILGNHAGSSGTVTQTGGTVDVVGSLTIGNAGTGKYTVDLGTTTVDGTTTIGTDGTLELGGGGFTTGSLSNTASGTFNHRDGTVSIDGGTFDPGASMTGSAVDFHIQGATSGDHSIVTLKNGASWNTPGTVRVARGENGTLNIQSGADVNVASILILGMGAENATGTANVTGTGSTLTTASNLFVGANENGILNVSNGGQVTANSNLILGNNAGSSGTVTQTGGTVDVAGSLTIGNAGTGKYTVDLGTTTVDSTTTIGTDGTLELGGGGFTTGSLDNAAGGTVNLTDGLLSVSNTFTPGSYFSMTGGELEAGAVSGDLAFSGGLFDVGTVNGNLTQDGGTLAPGNSPGTTTINGDYLLTGGILDMEVAGLLPELEYDFLDINGDWTITGGTLDVSLLGGFNPMLGNSFDLFDFNSLAGTFDAVNLPSLTGTLFWNTSNLYATGSLSIGDTAAVPAPSAIAMMSGLLLAGLAATSWRRRRRKESLRAQDS